LPGNTALIYRIFSKKATLLCRSGRENAGCGLESDAKKPVMSAYNGKQLFFVL